MRFNQPKQKKNYPENYGHTKQIHKISTHPLGVIYTVLQTKLVRANQYCTTNKKKRVISHISKKEINQAIKPPMAKAATHR